MASKWHQNGSLTALSALREYQGKTHAQQPKLAIIAGLDEKGERVGGEEVEKEGGERRRRGGGRRGSEISKKFV